jgi:hypothetical protein
MRQSDLPRSAGLIKICGIRLAIGMMSASFAALQGSMAFWKTWLKRSGALVMGVVLVQWLVLPACPCQLRGMFSSVEDSMANGPALPGPGLTEGLPKESCCCAEAGMKSIHAPAPDVSPPGVPVAFLSQQVLAAVPGPSGVGDRLRHSGVDPPLGGGLRAHLRWQVFLI